MFFTSIFTLLHLLRMQLKNIINMVEVKNYTLWDFYDGEFTDEIFFFCTSFIDKDLRIFKRPCFAVYIKRKCHLSVFGLNDICFKIYFLKIQHIDKIIFLNNLKNVLLNPFKNELCTITAQCNNYYT